jgi:hypothetical protein
MVAQGKYGGGSGEPNDPFLIYDANHMQAIGADANDWDKCFKLMADVDLGQFTGTEFNIIGFDYWNAFTGVFDGNDHMISNFTCDSNDMDYIGLFGYVDDPNAEIKNLGLIDPNVNAGTGNDVGSLVGQLSSGTITNCYSKGGNVAGSVSVGGLVGVNNGTIANCYSTASVSGSGSNAGGLVGSNWGTVTDCYSKESVSGVGVVGGLVGVNNGTIANCCSTGSVSGSGNSVGGLVGINRPTGSTISNSYSTGRVSGSGNNVGGLVGANRDTITNSYSTGRVSGLGSNVGGLVGRQSGTISDSYWDIETSSEPNMCGYGDCNNSYGLPTSQLHQQSTFQDWDFINTWNIGENQTYPYLRKYSPANLNKDHKVDFLDIRILCEGWLIEE